MLFLVRHAKAGHRSDGPADDSKRPLTESGRQQAEALAAPLFTAGATAPVLSSPYRRCLQTVEPFARRIGTTVVSDRRLAENQPCSPLVDLLGMLPEGAVMCSHGDMIPEVIAALQRRGCAITTPANWKKASVWALERDADGRFIRAAAWPPPDQVQRKLAPSR